jgi:hypothetical protein
VHDWGNVRVVWLDCQGELRVWNVEWIQVDEHLDLACKGAWIELDFDVGCWRQHQAWDIYWLYLNLRHQALHCQQVPVA